MNRKEEAAAGMLAGMQAGREQARLDKRLAADAVHAGDVAMVPLAGVLGRVGDVDTREPAPESVDAMAESLEALGLLEPLIVDNVGRLLGGKTRLLALRRLAAAEPDRWRLVPVRRLDFDAAADPARALAVEVAENEQRRAYTAAEVRALAERLRDAGFKATAGRPRKGTRALLPALGAVVGKSKRTLLRILAPAGGKETVPSVTISTIPEACARLHRALGAFARVAAAVKLKPNEARAVKAAGALANLLNPLAKKGRHAAD